MLRNFDVQTFRSALPTSTSNDAILYRLPTLMFKNCVNFLKNRYFCVFYIYDFMVQFQYLYKNIYLFKVNIVYDSK